MMTSLVSMPCQPMRLIIPVSSVAKKGAAILTMVGVSASSSIFTAQLLAPWEQQHPCPTAASAATYLMSFDICKPSRFLLPSILALTQGCVCVCACVRARVRAPARMCVGASALPQVKGAVRGRMSNAYKGGGFAHATWYHQGAIGVHTYFAALTLD